MKTFRIFGFATLMILALSLHSQQFTQTIKGDVTDSETGIGLPGATVVIPGSDPLIGTVTDLNGKFRIEKVPVGRYDVMISFVGYEPFYLRELIVGSAKEVVIVAALSESVQQMETVEIVARQDKDKPLNTMTLVGARQLSVEEARRYAGGVDDPALLATAFAGVAGNMSSNAIVVRGNAPKGLLWLMEGVQISNPNHYANITSFGGGAFTALSAQLLANSDFYTGAWPAEFGNAISGVFDVKMRNGNSEKYEHSVQLGTLGLDLSSEGPFAKGGNSSYLFNYRFSTFAFIAPLLPDDAAGNRFQDLSFKLNFPLKNGGVISLWGIGARDISDIKPNDAGDRTYDQDFQKLYSNQYMGAAGLNHRKTIGKSAYITTSLAASGNGLSWKQDQLNSQEQLIPDERVENDYLKISLSSAFNKKFSARHTNRTGIVLNNIRYNIDTKFAENAGEPLTQVSLMNGNSFLLQCFSESKIYLTSTLTINAGIHAQHFTLNNASTVEPRLSVQWQLHPLNSLSFGYGNHSMLEMLPIYFITRQNGNQTIFPNENLGFTRAHHLVLSWNHNLNEYTHFTVEPFYQKLYNIPVVDGTSFSLLNLDQDWFVDEVFASSGTGRNYGIDFTLERFMKNGFYYLFTASLFQSAYCGGDRLTRDARYNKQFVVNALVGKEWRVGKNHKNLISANARFTAMGGDRMSPVDLTASTTAREVVYDETRAFSDQKPDNFHLHLGMFYRKNRLNHASIWSVQLINAVGSKEFYGYKYNLKNDQIEKDEEMIVLPQISYKIEF